MRARLFTVLSPVVLLILLLGASGASAKQELLVLPDDIMPPPGEPDMHANIRSTNTSDYKVIPILFVPNDLSPHPFALQAINRQMQLIQHWYGEQLRNRTFTLEPARIVTGSHPLAYYYGDCYPITSPCGFSVGYSLWDNIFRDLDDVGYPWQTNRIVGVFFQNEGVGATALGGGGRFLVGINPFGDCLEEGCAARVSEGGTAHEFGHALGLPHPADEPGDIPWSSWDSLMGWGFYGFPGTSIVNTEVNPQLDMLYTSPFFNIPLGLNDGGFEDCLKSWSLSAGEGLCTIAVQRSGLSALQLLPDNEALVGQDVESAGGSTYDFSGWLNIPAQKGNFSVQVQILALSATESVLATSVAGNYTGMTDGWERIAISMLMPPGTAKARIQIIGQGAAAYADDFDFHLAENIPPNPLPLFYTDGDAVPTLQPELKWSEVTTATAFHIQAAANREFNEPLVDAIVPSPFYTIPGSLDYNTRYFWRVQAASGAGQSDWSPVWSFIPRTPQEYYNDEFEIFTLGSSWSWVREDMSHWSFGGPLNLRWYGGYLGITTQAGDLLGGWNNAKNLLLQNTPPGDFEASTIVNWWLPLSTNYQQGGLFIYQDDNNYIKLVHTYNDGYKIELLAEMDGRVITQASTIITEPCLIKIARVGKAYNGYYSPDGLTWRQIGQTITVNWPAPQMGLGAYSQLNGQEITAWFDWFRVSTPPPSTFNISGFKINGTNNNMMGIENWNILLLNPDTGAEITNATTNSMGFYKFSNLSNGTYKVIEKMRAGWMNVSPMSRIVNINGEEVMGVNFTNALIPSSTKAIFNISGFKLNGATGTGIAGWLISAENATTGAPVFNTTTNTAGMYLISNLTNGTYVVVEETREEFTPNGTTSQNITIAGHDVMNVNFTNQPLGSNLIKNPGFESGRSPWIFYTNGTGKFTASSPGYEGNNAANIDTYTGGTNVQLYQKGISLEPHTRYRLRFAAYSNTGRDLKVLLIMHGSPFTHYGLDRMFNLSKDWQEFSTEFTTTGFNGKVKDGRLMFYLAPFAKAGDKYHIDDVRLEKVTGTLSVTTTPANGDIYIDSAMKGTGSWNGLVSAGSHSVSFGPVSGYLTPSMQTVEVYEGLTTLATAVYNITNKTNIINNSGFEFWTTSWQFYTNGSGIFTAAPIGYEASKSANIVLYTGGNNIQLYQRGIMLEPNTHYKLSFAAYSTTGHDLKVQLIKHVSPYTGYGLGQTFNLSKDWQEFSTEFTTTGFSTTVNDGRLMFYLVPFAKARDKYYIDYVQLEKI